MKYISRALPIRNLLKQKSLFLLGPRATGKTTLIAHQLPKAKVYDLLDSRTFSKLVKAPYLLEEENQGQKAVIVIDEIQKLPSLLDEVHRLITRYDWKFLLTGSSARKLKRGAANLLAGRVWMTELFPFTFYEIPDFDLLQYLNRGGLPQVYPNRHYREELANYVALYLKEEIQAESLTRNLPSFANFLDLIALANGQEINYESLASDCGVSPSTIKNYLQILQDTLIGFSIPGFTKGKKRKAISRIKHYLFDIGVVNTLCNRGKILPKSELFGWAFEHFIIQEIRAYLSYRRLRLEMSYWRSTSQYEVDLIVGQELALEIKAGNSLRSQAFKGLRAFKEEGLVKNYALVSLEETSRTTKDGIKVYPWKKFLNLLWKDKLFNTKRS